MIPLVDLKKQYASISEEVGSGTEALHLSLVEAGVCAGDEVIVPANTYIATALGVSYTGATPVFPEIDEASISKVAEALLKAL